MPRRRPPPTAILDPSRAVRRPADGTARRIEPAGRAGRLAQVRFRGCLDIWDRCRAIASAAHQAGGQVGVCRGCRRSPSRCHHCPGIGGGGLPRWAAGPSSVRVNVWDHFRAGHRLRSRVRRCRSDRRTPECTGDYATTLIVGWPSCGRCPAPVAPK
jgi:hypothetical protein